VLGYRFVAPPLVAIDDATPHVVVNLYFRLNRPLRGHLGDATGSIGPSVDGGLLLSYAYLGRGCYYAGGMELAPGYPVAVGLTARVTLRLTTRTPPLQALVPMIAIPPDLPNGVIEEDKPYERLLGCPTG
jgi:hypothetical protein